MKDRIYRVSSLVSKYAIFGLFFFIPISNALVELLSAFALLGFVVKKIIKPDFRFLKFWPNIFLLTFVFFSALSLVNSAGYLGKSFTALFFKWMQYIGVCLFAQDVFSEKKSVKKAIPLFLFSAFLVVVSGLSQRFLGIEFLRGRDIADMGRGICAVTSSFCHYNNLGAYLVIAIPLIVALMICVKEKKGLKFIFLFIFAILSIAVILFTFSRGSWTSLIFSFLLLLFISKKYNWFLLFLPILVTFFSISQYQDRLFSIIQDRGDADRFIYWSAAFRMIRENPFLGKGIGTFMDYFSKYVPNLNPSYAHNCYLQIWAETGFFSLVSFLMYITAIIWLGIKKFLKTKDFLLLGLLCGLFGFLVHSFFDTNLYSLQLAVLFWVWAGLVLALIRQEDVSRYN